MCMPSARDRQVHSPPRGVTGWWCLCMNVRLLTNHKCLQIDVVYVIILDYTVTQKNDTTACCNFDQHQTILIIFGRNVSKSNGTLFSHLIELVLLPYLGKQKAENCIFSLKCWMLFCQQTHKTHLYYHSVTAEPPFICTRISRMHQTKSRKGA